jgi:hypothetical protein
VNAVVETNETDDKTPLSDRISELIANQSSKTWEAFLVALLDSQLGVIAEGAPASTRHGHYEAHRGDLSLGSTGDHQVLTCADPEVFRRRYPTQPFNASMDARAVLRTVLANAKCKGMLVNSAAGEHSVPITRDQIVGLLNRK